MVWDTGYRIRCDVGKGNFQGAVWGYFHPTLSLLFNCALYKYLNFGLCSTHIDECFRVESCSMPDSRFSKSHKINFK